MLKVNMESSWFWLSFRFLLGTHNICSGWEIRKSIFDYALLSGAALISMILLAFQVRYSCTLASCDRSFSTENEQKLHHTVKHSGQYLSKKVLAPRL